MALIVAEVYDALRAINVPEDKARTAAEALAGYEPQTGRDPQRSAAPHVDGRAHLRGRALARAENVSLGLYERWPPDLAEDLLKRSCAPRPPSARGAHGTRL